MPHFPEISMTKRVAVVTGGIGGLGTAICKQLARDGRQVIAADLGSRQDRLAAFREETREYNGDIVFAPADVGSYDACADLVKHVSDEWGGVDIVVNAAGITRDTSLKRMTPAQWTDLMRVDLDSIFNVCRNVVDGMTERGFGRIVNISSVNGQTGQFGQTNYSAAKAGDLGFTKALAQEGARAGITVNVICPGYIATDMVMAVPEKVRESIIAQIPVGRLGEPEDVVEAILFAADPKNAFMTGETLAVVGESGSGKSTLARAITGLLPPEQGSVTFDGRKLGNRLADRPKQDLRQVQMIYQMADVAMNPRQTVGTIIGRPLEFYFGLRGRERDARVRELLDEIEMGKGFADRYPAELSG
ncbi:hypothetical protein COL154_014165, partial [Colletotrichum chrysophilum]